MLRGRRFFGPALHVGNELRHRRSAANAALGLRDTVGNIRYHGCESARGPRYSSRRAFLSVRSQLARSHAAGLAIGRRGGVEPRTWTARCSCERQHGRCLAWDTRKKEVKRAGVGTGEQRGDIFGKS